MNKSKIITQCIVFAIKKQKLSIRDMAKKADVSPYVVQTILNGTGNPTLDNLTKICEALKLKIEIR